jgi:SAM-dependent methyltransferase
MSESPEYYGHLTFNAPLSDARADAMASRLAAAQPTSILDVGCGWAELLLRVTALLPTASARGVDTEQRHLARARANATARGLTVELDNLPGGEVTEPADLVICIGSSHAFGETVPDALAALRKLVRPGGRLLYGEGTWEEHGPVDPSLVWEDMPALPSVAGLTDLAVEAGFRPLWVETASQDELFAFESGFLADVEEWLMHHDDAEQRAKNDEHRKRWLGGYRNGFGFAYLTLGVPA